MAERENRFISQVRNIFYTLDWGNERTGARGNNKTLTPYYFSIDINTVRVDKARLAVTYAIRHRPRDADLFVLAANVYAAANERELAVRSAERACKLAPRRADLRDLHDALRSQKSKRERRGWLHRLTGSYKRR